MPYRSDMNADFMMANIFSQEIPLIAESLADWLRAQTSEFLARWAVDPHAISGRDFYPRTLLGAYLQAQFQTLCDQGRAAGHSITVHLGCRVMDVSPSDMGFRIVPSSGDLFTHVVLATGHTWDAVPAEGTAQLRSPWPARGLRGLPAGPIGILGSSLSAVDVAVALAMDHGAFTEASEGLQWSAHTGHEGFSVTMVSKNGILPEADFYYPYPYELLVHLIDANVHEIIAARPGDCLQGVFDLLLCELEACDPQYLAGLNMPQPSIPAFSEAYFARRQRMGAFRALRMNLTESRKTITRKQTVAWRYTLLRGHEAFEWVLPHLSETEWETFREHLLPVFADCYAAVPHLSLERLAALRAADVIDIVDCGDEAVFADDGKGGMQVMIGATKFGFDCMIDARGQKAAGLADLPFPGLVAALAEPSGDVDANFALALQPQFAPGAYCLAMPQVLVRHPFSQGLPNCADLAEHVANHLLSR